MCWVGTDGQKGTLSFTQDSTVGILPRQREACRDDLQLVEFKSFALTGKQEVLGTFRYKEGGFHREVKPGQLGLRVLRAQLLGSSAGEALIAGQPDGSPGKAKRRESSRKSEKLAQLRRSPRQHGTIRRTVDEQMARAEKDRQIKEACVKLAKHPEWLQLGEGIVERNNRHLQTGSLSSAANCFGFGKKRYHLLTAGRALTFARCITCTKVFNGLADGSRHQCQPAGERQQVQQRQSQRQPQEHLQGGVQLATHLLHQVLESILGCSLGPAR